MIMENVNEPLLLELSGEEMRDYYGGRNAKWAIIAYFADHWPDIKSAIYDFYHEHF